jgi:hypothetical protein
MTPTPDVAPAHELRIVGMSRSRNHALLNWIMGQAA